MLTQKEKNFLLALLDQTVPSGKNREEVRKGLAIVDTIYKKVEQMPVEEPVEPKNDAVTAVRRRLRK